MKLKRTLLVALLCFVCLFSLLAESSYQNRQKIIPVGSPVYEDLVLLYISTGHAQPSSSGPWSADELLLMLQRIPYGRLDDGQRVLYDRVASALYEIPKLVSDDSFGFSPTIIVFPEMYFHTNTAFDTEPDWSYGFTQRKPALAFRFEGWAADHFYGFVELSLGLTRYHSTDSAISWEGSPELLYTPMFRFNIPMLGVAALGELSMNMPYRAFLSAGGSHWNLQIGRDRLSWGVGESGNMILGDHYPMHQFLRFTTYHSVFKYTFVTSFFPHPVNYRPDEGQSESDFITKKLSDPNYQMRGLSMFMGHRFEFRFLQDRVSFALSETIMYQTLDGYFDVQVFNPLMLFHDMYIRGNSNSLLGFELDATPCDGVNVYGLFLIDDLAMGSEPTSGPEANPNALGGMLGLKLSFPYRNGMFFGSLEAVYADPYLYKRDGDVEYIVALREANNTAGQIDGTGQKYHKYYIGYQYGGDVVVGNLRFGYTIPGRLTASLLTQLRFKGLVGIDTPWSTYSEGEKTPTAPSTPIETDKEDESVEVTLRIDPSCTLYIGGGLSFHGTVSFLTQWHRRHATTAGPWFDMQLVLGVTYQI